MPKYRTTVPPDTMRAEQAVLRAIAEGRVQDPAAVVDQLIAAASEVRDVAGEHCPSGGACGACGASWPCPYHRLAQALDELDKIDRLRAS